MKVVIVTSGSRGDVQVGICTAALLSSAQHSNMCDLLVSHGLTWGKLVCFLAFCASNPVSHVVTLPVLRLQPYVMLGLELQQRGHDVVLATEQRMEPLVKQLGQGKLGYAKVSGDPTLMLYGKRNQVNTAAARVRSCCLHVQCSVPSVSFSCAA
jgi:hypothetical protein